MLPYSQLQFNNKNPHPF